MTWTQDGGEWSVSHPSRRLGGSEIWPGHFGEKKKSIVPVGIQTPDHPATSQVTILTATLAPVFKLIGDINV